MRSRSAVRALTCCASWRSASFLQFDVGIGANPAHHRPALVVHRQRAYQVPAVGAVGAADAKFNLVSLPRSDRCAPRCDCRVQVVRVHGAGPAAAVKLAWRRADVVIHALVEPVEHAVTRRGPHLVGHRLGQGAEGHFAGRHRLFGQQAVGDVGALHENAEHLAALVAHRLVDEVEEAFSRRRGGRGGGGKRHRGTGERLAAGVQAIEQRDEALLLGFRQCGGHRLADHLTLADQLGVSLVDQREDMIRAAEHGHETGGLVEHRAQAFAFAIGVPFGAHLVGGVDDDRQHPGRLAIGARQRRIIKVQPHRCVAAVAKQRQLDIGKGQGLPRQAGLHHMVVEVGRFGPPLAHICAQQLRMAVAGERRISVVIDHHTALAPQRDHWQRRAQHHAHHRLHAVRPAPNRADRGGRPVNRGNQFARMAAIA